MTESGFTFDVVSSSDNSVAKRIRSLRQRKTREAERAFVVEGARAVEDALASGANAELILLRSGFLWSAPHGSSIHAIRYVEPRLFDALAETISPQPILGVFPFPEIDPDPSAVPFVLVADGIRDPGNLGTLLRSAAAVGANLVLLTPGTVDAYNGKVVRAAMGAHFRLVIDELDDQWSEWLRVACPVRVIAKADGERVYTDLVLTGPLAVIVGSEADGATESGQALATIAARIPLVNDIESLNAGVAGSIIMFEVCRQRGAQMSV